MKSPSYWIVIAALLYFVYTDATAQLTVVKAVIKKQELLDLGIHRASDVVRILPGWYSYSTDGYTRFISNTGYHRYTDPKWVILINEQPLQWQYFEHLS